MASYGYEAIENKTGKIIKGSVEGDNLDLIRTQLKNQGLTLLEIKEQSILTRDINIEIGGYPKPRDLSVFCRQFVSMTRTGISILECLKLLEEQTENVQLKKAISGVRLNVEKGETLSDSLKAYPKVFPELMVNMAAAGEASGSLDIAMERMATQFEKTAKTQALVKKALIYPTVVGILAVAMVVVMIVVIIPRYGKMFQEMDAKMPKITLGVLAFSEFLKTYWFIIVPVLMIVILFFIAWGKTLSGKHVLHKIKLKIPAVKNLEVKQHCSLMARTLSTLMAAGVPLVEATEIVANVMTNIYFKEALETCHDDILIGRPISRPLEETKLFPPMVYHMTRIGEETGDVEGMLTKLADYYDEEVEIAVQAFMAFLEPMIIIVLAAVVGLLIAACFAPMVSLYSALEHL